MVSSRQMSPLAIVSEVVAFVLVAAGAKFLVNFVSWRFSGPISLTLTLVVLTLYLRWRGMRWSDLGLRRLQDRRARLVLIPQVLLTFAAFAAVTALALFGGPAIGLHFMAEDAPGVAARWGDIQGNLPMFLVWLGLVWTTAAFGEEMFFRGYLITRLQTAFAGFRFGTVWAVVVPAVLFGLGHLYYQGPRGLVMTTLIALAFGSMFLLFKRNLWPVIIWHGIIDTMTFTAFFMNWDV